MRDREISNKARNKHTKACNTSKLFIFHRVSNAAVKQTETKRAGTYSAHRRRHDYTSRFLSSRLALSTITANSSIAKARTTSSSSVRSGFWFSFFFGKNLQNSPSSSATKTKGSTKHRSRQIAPRPTPTHPSFRMLRSTNQDNGRSTAKKKKNREAERKTERKKGSPIKNK